MCNKEDFCELKRHLVCNFCNSERLTNRAKVVGEVDRYVGRKLVLKGFMLKPEVKKNK